MATNKKQKRRLLIAIVVTVVILIVLIVAIVVSKKVNSAPKTAAEIAAAEDKYKQEKKEAEKAKLSEMSEFERMDFYCGQFFGLADDGDYEEAYKLLNSDYKENFFPTLKNFEKYFEDYFPSRFSLVSENIERLGEIYVLKVHVKDAVNGQYGHNFTMYVVLKENALNEFEISFSRNSAVEEG